MHWVVDASNVIGSRPDGWWRDRTGATKRLIAQLEAFTERTGEPVTVVLDAGPADLARRERPPQVVIARRRGRDAADDEIVRLLEAHPTPHEARVVTSDAALAARARALGAEVHGAGGFRDLLR